MAGPIKLSTVLKLIQTCVNKSQTATSNHKTCVRLTDSLSMAVKILQNILSNNHLTIDAKKTADHLLQRLSVVASEANDQFDQCQSHKISEKISAFLHASSIQENLGQLESELQTIMAMLSLLLHQVKPPNQDQRVPCKWGLDCRNIRDNQHCTKYSHPHPEIPCKWGAQCYDHNDSHRAKYSHPQSNTQQ